MVDGNDAGVDGNDAGALPANAASSPAARMADVSGRVQTLLMDHMARMAHKLPAADNPVASMTALWSQWARAMTMVDPAQIVRMQTEFWQDSLKLWSGMLTGQTASLPAATLVADKRFASPAWTEQPVFDLLRRSYLLASHHMMAGVGQLQGLSEAEKVKAQFQARQFIDALSPANFALTNPDVIAAAQASDGESLVRGLEHMLDDLGRGQLRLTDETAFEVGRNVAATPGKVVFCNRLFELIQYSPATETVLAEPLLIFPPWINKFYILDLTPQKSFIGWAVAQGLTVFVVSWKNADESLAEIVLDNYVIEGQITALETVLAITAAPAAHTIGYCVAGTTLAATLAVLAARGDAGKVASATYFTAQVDFADAGELLNFVDDKQIAMLAELSRPRGVLDGRYLSASFNMLRSTDLIWSYVVNNYLMGKDYAPFDLLFWNSDATNVPARWHQDYLRDCYRDNLLAKPGGITVAAVPIDLRTIHTASYVQAGRDDHIAPLASVYKLTRAFGTAVRFVLAGSGHIAGVVNPPASGKYQYWALPEGTANPATPAEFQAAAAETKGSWWPDWMRWITAHSSAGRVAARAPGSAAHPATNDAPGRYVREKVG
jgi:polyhydroxyalkanoate synthase subunit PhaC